MPRRLSRAIHPTQWAWVASDATGAATGAAAYSARLWQRAVVHSVRLWFRAVLQSVQLWLRALGHLWHSLWFGRRSGWRPMKET